MANTTDSITLNGYDWSNLYHIDYSGGTRGEKLEIHSKHCSCTI